MCLEIYCWFPFSIYIWIYITQIRIWLDPIETMKTCLRSESHLQLNRYDILLPVPWELCHWQTVHSTSQWCIDLKCSLFMPISIHTCLHECNAKWCDSRVQCQSFLRRKCFFTAVKCFTSSLLSVINGDSNRINWYLVYT